ncbi:M4 family metallopeptidase [Longirhabdus pacifica]|uniref:M4 family metallopeptidase n=1 Tax=Longirhabdus pacifica TaxID=2305227 RepID=UPI0010091EC0|nr:M4 family metallopeptidase [Longirhabdus pacifica]
MTCHKHLNHCHCTFVPSFVLNNLAKKGVNSAQVSIHQSNATRRKRKNKDVDMTTILADHSAQQMTAKGNALRQIYDCKQEYEQRVALVQEEGGPSLDDADANYAYEYAGVVRSYFENVLNRDSIDNSGLDLILNVHYGTNYLNAFWDGDEMTFGDGDNRIFTSFAKSLDVVAHELAHGVTQFTANLIYERQPGALNEHFSDVFGTAIKQHALRQTAHEADWLIGNDIMGPSLFGESLRSMKEPGTAYDNDLLGTDPQPSHMDHYYDGSSDNYGVHINSGIFNKVFYLVSMEIGTDKATQIWYHALQNLWEDADFTDAVAVLVRSGQILTKNKYVPLGTTQTIRSAFREVGL